MKTAVLHCSPRRNGNLETLAKSFFAGLKGRGIDEVKEFYVNKMKIACVHSETPHIHYELQKGKDTLSCEGLPSRFRHFQLLLGNTTRRIENLCQTLELL